MKGVHNGTTNNTCNSHRAWSDSKYRFLISSIVYILHSYQNFRIITHINGVYVRNGEDYGHTLPW